MYGEGRVKRKYTVKMPGIAPLLHQSEILRLRRGERRAGSDPAQFDHAVADVAVLGQMRGSIGFTVAGDHLVDRPPLGKLWVEFAAELTKPTGACVEAIDDSAIDVFHERGSWKRRERMRPVCEAESQYSASADCRLLRRSPLVLQGKRLRKPPRDGRKIPATGSNGLPSNVVQFLSKSIDIMPVNART
jgi:hypothetical protein